MPLGRDVRPAYAIFDSGTQCVTFRRVAYDRTPLLREDARPGFVIDTALRGRRWVPHHHHDQPGIWLNDSKKGAGSPRLPPIARCQEGEHGAQIVARAARA